jgi:hypothetical protein
MQPQVDDQRSRAQEMLAPEEDIWFGGCTPGILFFVLNLDTRRGIDQGIND